MRSTRSSSARFDFESLARALSTAEPLLVVWKGARDLSNQGDLDCSAPRSTWSTLAHTFREWAGGRGIAASIECEHALGRLVLVGCGGTAGAQLLQLDVVDELIVHGAPAWTAADVGRGAVRTTAIAHTRAGAEGVFRRLADPQDPLAAPLVAGDRGAAADVARHLGVRGRLAASNRRWARFALELVLAGRPALHVRVFLEAVRSNSGSACPVLRALRNERTVAGSLEHWVDVAASTHRVHRLQRP